MIAVLLGFCSAVVFGASDFLAGVASRRSSPLVVGAVANAVAAVVVLALLLPARWAGVDSSPSDSALIWGAVAGVSGTIGTWAFYAALAIGPMSVISPAVAGVYAVLPAAVGVAAGERFSPLGWVALAAVLLAGLLLALSRDGRGQRPGPRALLLGLVAGVGYAGYLVAIDRAPAASGLTAVLVDFTVCAALLALVILFAPFAPLLRRTGSRDRGLGEAVRPSRPVTGGLGALVLGRAVRMTLLCGVLIGLAGALLILALQHGELAVVGVLNSLYPLGTVLLALVVLRERLSAPQWIGVLLALAGSAALGLG